MANGIKFDKVVIDCPDPRALAVFYAELLGWRVGYDTGDFVIIGSGESNVDIGFQRNEDYVRPVWPEKGSEQQQMLHLDFAVLRDELANWVRRAEELGAKAAPVQYSDDWTVMLDPDGHPFCLDAT